MEAVRDDDVLRAGELEIRPAEYRAVAAGRTLALSLRELELLAALATHFGFGYRFQPERSHAFHSTATAP
jgi:DNA-binding response OmpR family regulator